MLLAIFFEKYVIEVLKSLINPNFKCFPFGGSDEGVVYWHLRSTRAMQHGQTLPLSYYKGTYNHLVTKPLLMANLYLIHCLQFPHLMLMMYPSTWWSS